MSRKHVSQGRPVYLYPNDFPRRLERLKEESGLTWADLARRLDTPALNLWRWRNGIRPSRRHLFALLNLADELRLGHILTGR